MPATARASRRDDTTPTDTDTDTDTGTGSDAGSDAPSGSVDPNDSGAADTPTTGPAPTRAQKRAEREAAEKAAAEAGGDGNAGEEDPTVASESTGPVKFNTTPWRRLVIAELSLPDQSGPLVIDEHGVTVPGELVDQVRQAGVDNGVALYES